MDHDDQCPGWLEIAKHAASVIANITRYEHPREKLPNLELMADKGNLTSATANMGGWETAGGIFGQKFIKIQSIFGPSSIVFPLKTYSALFQISIERSQGVFSGAMFQIGDGHRFKQFPKKQTESLVPKLKSWEGWVENQTKGSHSLKVLEPTHEMMIGSVGKKLGQWDWTSYSPNTSSWHLLPTNIHNPT